MATVNEFVEKLKEIGKDFDKVSRKSLHLNLDEYLTDSKLTSEMFEAMLKDMPFIDEIKALREYKSEAMFSSEDCISVGLSRVCLYTKLIKNCINGHIFDYDTITLEYADCERENGSREKRQFVIQVYEGCLSGIEDKLGRRINQVSSSLIFTEQGGESNIVKSYIILKLGTRLFEGLSEIPNICEYLTPDVVLQDTISHVGYWVGADSSSTISIKGNVTIEDEVPINTNRQVTIVGPVGSKLTLINTESQQPCIGARTNTGMSYGRWCPGGSCPKEIVIDGVEVVCQSKVEGFSIGQYGSNDMPKITLLNGGKLICPEMEGERIVAYQAEAPQGSTKISALMKYKIIHLGDTPDKLLSEGQKKILQEICEYDPKYVKEITFKTSTKGLEKALELLELSQTINVSELIKGEHNNHLDRVAEVAILHLNLDDVSVDSDEMQFEMTKTYAVCKAIYGISTHEWRYTYNLIKYIREHAVLTDYIDSIMYHLIFSYAWSWPRGISKREQVDRFLSECSHRVNDDALYYLATHREKIVGHYHIELKE